MLKGQLYKVEAEEMRAEPRPGAQLLLITAHAADKKCLSFKNIRTDPLGPVPQIQGGNIHRTFHLI